MTSPKPITPILFILVLAPWLLYAQTGPAGVGTNDGSSALKLWLDAGVGVFKDTSGDQRAENGSSVFLWRDLSGSNHHVRAAKDTTSPSWSGSNPLLNNQASLRFYRTGTNRKRTYLSSSSFAKTNDITIYCIFHALNRAAGNNITPYQSKTYHENMWYYGAGLVDGGAGFVNDISLAFNDTSIAAGAGDSTTAIDYCVKTPASIRKTYFALLQKEAWTGTLSIAHNTSLPATYQAGAQPINNAPRYYIGSTSDVKSPYDSPFFDGYISSVLVYNKILNSAEKIILENYLAAKYGIALRQNDLYTFDEAHHGNFDHEMIGIGMASDGSTQLIAKGEGLLEIGNAKEMDKGTFVFAAHNGKPATASTDDIPEGIQYRLERKWVCSKIGRIKNFDILIDPKETPALDNQDVMLLIDTDNNGSFSNEKVGEGMIPLSEVTSHGRFLFRGVALHHGNRFTFAKVKPACQEGCDAYFSPNGDGVADVYFLDHSGKTVIYDRAGKLIRTIATPAYWDGTNEKGEIANPGIYFLIANEDVQKTVTLVR